MSAADGRTDTGPIAVVVHLAIAPDAMAAFLPWMHDIADASLDRELGCRAFDVRVDAGGEDAPVLYELYDDAAAFETHLRSAHCLAFDSATAGMIVSKSVRRYRRAPR